MSTSTPTPNPPKALPKPESKFSTASFTFWHGIGFHALISVGLLIIFLVLLPWIFPDIRQSLPKIKDLEQKVQSMEHHIAQLPSSTPPELGQIRDEIAKLEQKLQEQRIGSSQKSPLDLQHLLQMGYLLRLEGALVAGEGYENIFSKLLSSMHLKEQDFPILSSQQKMGLKSLSQIIAQLKEHESKNTGISLPKPEELPHEVLSKFLKIRKHPKNNEAPQDSRIHQILTLLMQNKVEEAYEVIGSMDEKESQGLSQDLQNLIKGRQELEKLWQIWESQIPLKSGEEKGA
ncbi:MAG TPA: hypothetical protein VNJ29_01260 [Candidatus Nitrosotenuis sp.]|nr:hypothetical protein [Candidatus Nitrosotenuis sp.]